MTVIGYTEPMTSISENIMNLINEAFVLLFTYHLYQFTEFMTDLENRLIVGKSLVYTAMINVAFNLSFVLMQNILLAQRKIKLKYLACKQSKRIK